MTDDRRTAVRRGTVWSAVALASLSTILVTPFVLDSLAPDGTDWERLSAVSQTYGAVSVFISAAALVGVALSLAYQARQTRIQNGEAQRSAHRELVLLTLNEAAYQVCWEPPNTPMTRERWKQLLIANLIVSMWRTDYKLGLMGDRLARAVLQDYFRGEIGRAYWHNSGPSWHRYFAGSRDRREQRFLALAEDAYRAAVAAGPAVPAAEYFRPAAD
ncbi:DUF6082 family protein [Streptomyces naphthomycinicus]|uniref:DUF6082 family protein n=1 Tax=Streptomyces naphthomycinicus TaxID=2872625 RepID=UPI001CEC54E8|nr:DUF6082 family protein [Streptomyces sp. TML10]